MWYDPRPVESLPANMAMAWLGLFGLFTRLAKQLWLVESVEWE